MSSPQPSTSKRNSTETPSPKEDGPPEPNKSKQTHDIKGQQDGNDVNEYERNLIAHLILQLTINADVKDFALESRCRHLGYFNDIFLWIKYESHEESYAFQLKYADNQDELDLDLHFGMDSENCWNDTKNRFEDREVNLIMFTNRSFKYIIPYKKFHILEKTFDIRAQDKPETIFNQILSEGFCYKFVDPENETHDWNKLILYTDQISNEEIQEKIRMLFKEKFSLSGTDLQTCLDLLHKFINEWVQDDWQRHKTVKKEAMEHAIAWCLLDPYIKCWSFRGQPVPGNSKLLANAILRCQKMIFSRTAFEKIKNIWVNFKIDYIKLTETVEMHFLICKSAMLRSSIHFEENTTERVICVNVAYPWERLNEIERTKTAWLSNRCPLVVEARSGEVKDFICKVVDLLCKNGKFVLLYEDKSKIPTGFFHDLSDLKDEAKLRPVYQDVARNFFCKLQGKETITLEQLIGDDEEIKKMIGTNELVEMLLDEPLLIGEKCKTKPYIKQSLSSPKIKLDHEFLSKMQTTVIVISCFKKWGKLKSQFPFIFILEVDSFLSEDAPNAQKMMLVSERQCSEEKFNKICVKSQSRSCHHFKMIDEDSEIYLEWISSNKNITGLRRFINNDSNTTARDINSKINLICDEPGTGKSTFLDNIKTSKLPTCWTILVNPYDYSMDLHKQIVDVESFKNYIVDKVVQEHGYNSFEKKLLRHFVQKGRVCYCWDGLDQLSGQNLELIKEIIVKLKEEPSTTIWITSRIHLKQELEEYFNVFARRIKIFDQQEQKMCIESLLNSNQNISNDSICEKIRQHLGQFSYQDILGIPLQIYLLVQLIPKDKRKKLTFLDKITSATDMYEHFVNEQVNLCYKKKKNRLHKKNLGATIADFRNREVDYCKKMSIRLHFANLARKWRVVLPNRRHVKLRQTKFLTLRKDGQEKFVHESFGEYFAALYLSENHKKIKDIDDFLFDQKYDHIRFFLDLIWSKNYSRHVAVLYRNHNYLKVNYPNSATYEKNDNDQSHLQLACSWCTKYPLVETEIRINRKNSQKNQCVIKRTEDIERIRSISENENYKETLNFLLSKFNKEELKSLLSRSDLFFGAKSFSLWPLIKLVSAVDPKDKERFLQQHMYSILYYSILFDIDDVVELIDLLKNVHIE